MTRERIELHHDRAALMTTVEVSRATGVTRKALRVYEEMGLVRPAGRTDCGYRLYDEAALHRLRLINRAKALGLSLAESGRLLSAATTCCGDDQGQLLQLIEQKLDGNRRRIGQLESLQELLQAERDRLLHRTRRGDCEPILCTCGPVPSYSVEPESTPAAECRWPSSPDRTPASQKSSGFASRSDPANARSRGRAL